jgi:hypothetical protein
MGLTADFRERLSSVVIDPFEIIFIDDGRHGLFAPLIAAADNAARTVNEHVGIGAQNGGRKNNAKTNYCVNGELTVHVEQNAPGRDVGGLRKILARIVGADGYRKPKRKPD